MFHQRHASSREICVRLHGIGKPGIRVFDSIHRHRHTTDGAIVGTTKILQKWTLGILGMWVKVCDVMLFPRFPAALQADSVGFL